MVCWFAYLYTPIYAEAHVACPTRIQVRAVYIYSLVSASGDIDGYV